MRVYFNRPVLSCLYWLICPLMIFGQSTSTEEDRIKNLLDKINTERKYVEELSANNLTNLPVGIKKTISNTTIVIAIDSARITPQGMLINAYTQLTLPSTSRVITFALRGAIITPAGLSPAGPTRLEVISDFRIPFNSQVSLHIPANGRNFIDWECSGFRSVNLSGQFEFSREIFLPDEPGKDAMVTAGFEVNTSDLNNIMVATSISPFRIKGLGDMSFSVMNAVADMSDFVNCEGFAFPKDYQSIFGDMPQLWRGFFLKELIIKLPSELGNGKRTEINARDVLIDDYGVSGRFAAKNILSIDQGNASGWPFSITSIEIGLIQNRLVAGEISGKLGVPFLGDEPIGYSAQIVSSHENLIYNFALQTAEAAEYPVPFGGTVRLDKGCIFSLRAENGRFIPSAVLNGSLYLSGESANIEGLRFERLHLIAESPYITGGKFDSKGGAGFNIAGFGLSVDSITLAFRKGKAALGLNARVAIMNRNDKGVSASTRMFINASVKRDAGESGSEDGRLRWSYDGTILEGVRVKGNVSLFTLDGNVFIYRNHPVYGDGFSGSVGFTAGKIIKDTARVDIRFGSKEDYKYWFAHLDIPAKIPLGTITLSNLGGGAYGNMERANLYSVTSDYIPKKDAGIGLMADVGMYVKTEDIFNADLRLEIAINKSGGVRFIRFAGDGRFFNPDDESDNLVKMTAGVSMVYDNVNNSFHANLGVFLNIANVIRGIGPNDLLGEAVIHSDPSDWYVYIGRPSFPLGVEVAGLLRTETYFMAGTKIENMPLPPSEVASIISGIDLDFMKNERGVASGHGVAFGMSFKASAGVGREKGFVYAYFNAGAGADIMLQNYGGAKCEGRSGPIGINGWYASGQGYAYLTGRIGIRVKSSEFDIMSVAAALLVQAKMPNPSWFRGNIAARYSILGGLVKGKLNVQVVLGEECVIVNSGSELGELKLIGDMSPASGSRDVDVFAAPQVSFNTGIGREFRMANIKDEYASYRVILDQFDVKNGNKILKGDVAWNPSQDMATLKLPDILPGKQPLSATVKVHIEKRTDAGWQILDGSTETSTISFDTGEEPRSIPANNVTYSYPLRDQYNFYRAEYPHGYIKLNRGQPVLFMPESDGIRWSYFACFNNGSQNIIVPVTYDNENSAIEFDIPGNLSGSSIYKMSILKSPVAGIIDGNLRRSELLISTVNPLDSVRIAQSDITQTGVSENDVELHSLSFRTSLFSTINEKIAQAENWNDEYNIDDESAVKSHMSLLFIRASSEEIFDKYEIEGSGENFGPLVSLKALRGVPWIDNHVFPLIYDQYGTGGLTLNRDISVLGLFPERAVYLANTGNKIILSDGKSSAAEGGDFYLKYFVAKFVHFDYYELRNKAAALWLETSRAPTPQALTLMAGSLKDLSRGSYPFSLTYRLPGGEPTFSKIFQFNYK